MFNRILVPLDGSSFGEAALRPAVSMVRRSGGELRLVSVHEPGLNPSRGDMHAEVRRWREEYLTRVSRTFLDVSLSTVVREGEAETQILEEAESWGADVIVMSTHGRGAVSSFWLGSVADHCLRNTRLPLMLVRARPSAMGLGDALFAPKRIVVPVDGSELAERGLEPATALAQSFGAALEIIRVVPERDASPPPAEGHLRLEADETRDRSHEYVHAVAGLIRRFGLTATSNVVAHQHPAQAIIECSAGDLVVMATHSRSQADRAQLGSVTDKVVRGSRGPVLAIPVGSAVSDTLEREPAPIPMVLARRVVG